MAVRHAQKLQTGSFEEFLKKSYQHNWKKNATGTCLCLENDSYKSDLTSQFSRLNIHYLDLAQCYLSNSRHSVCSSTGPQKEGYHVLIISLLNNHMSNLAEQPLIPCPSIAKYWQSYITKMTTWWQNQAKSSEMSEVQLLSSVRILLIQSPDYPPSESTFFIEHNLLCLLIRALWHCKPSFKAHLIAEVGADTVKNDDHRKISFQSMALGSNFIFLFTLK